MNTADERGGTVTASALCVAPDSKPIISLLHATRGRPKQYRDRARQWLDRARTHAVEYVFSLDDDEMEDFERLCNEVHNGQWGCAFALAGRPHMNNAAWNRAWWRSSYRVHQHGWPDQAAPLTVQVSDDFEPPQDWDRIIVERLGGLDNLHKPLVLGVADPHFTPPYSGDGLLTLYIATQAYLKRCGYYLYPDYPSVFSDNDLTAKAALDDVLIDAYDVCFLHHWHGSDVDPLRDDTYARHMTTECNHGGSGVWHRRCDEAFADGWPKPSPFNPGDPREAYFAGRYEEAYAGFDRLMKKYHLNYCGGRFLAHGIHHMLWMTAKALGREPRKSVRDPA